jgi:glycerol-3-phosphate O-acyltransferase
VTGWLGRRALRTIHEFRTRLARYHLQHARAAKAALAADPLVETAVLRHAQEHSLTHADVRRRVEQYVDEIVPQLNILSYYKIGYNLARIVLNLLYRVTVDYQDEAALERIPKRDVVVYAMNHRSNVDYVVVAYVLAYGAHVSYAVGEWARVWPLEYVFKSFGSYFIRRGYREPLYHTVLEQYVRLITKNGVTQGFFPEGRLSRDGRLGPPKLGLLDYVCRTVLDPAFDRDIWFVPVAINFDRVLEDRALIRELVDERDRPRRLAQLWTVASYVGSNAVRLVTGRLKRYGRAAVNFGTPISLKRAWGARASQGAAATRAREARGAPDGAHRRDRPGHAGAARRRGVVVVRTNGDPQSSRPRADGAAAGPAGRRQRQGGARRDPYPGGVGPRLADAPDAAAGGGRGRWPDRPPPRPATARVLRQLDRAPAADPRPPRPVPQDARDRDRPADPAKRQTALTAKDVERSRLATASRDAVTRRRRDEPR